MGCVTQIWAVGRDSVMDEVLTLAGGGAEGVGTLICSNINPSARVGTGPRLMIVWDGERPVGQFYLEEAAASPAGGPTNPRVSVVICTRDRPAELARCLASF